MGLGVATVGIVARGSRSLYCEPASARKVNLSSLVRSCGLQDPSPDADRLPEVSCVDITERMAELLEHLSGYPLSEEAMVRVRRTPEWLQARTWGWVMESGELTGTGHRHAHDPPTGILPRGD